MLNGVFNIRCVSAPNDLHSNRFKKKNIFLPQENQRDDAVEDYLLGIPWCWLPLRKAYVQRVRFPRGSLLLRKGVVAGLHSDFK